MGDGTDVQNVEAAMEKFPTGVPLRVVLADDHAMFREGLAKMLAVRGGLEVVGSTKNGVEAVELVKETRPDIVVMQVETPVEKGKANLRRMLALSPAPRVVMVTMFEDPRLMRDMLDQGASAYVVKSASVEELISVLSGADGSAGDRNVVLAMPRELLEGNGGGSGGLLSPRELEILILAARGYTNRRAAVELFIAEATIKRHLANAYAKMKVSSRGEATKKALAEGWILLPDIVETPARLRP